MSAHRFRGIIGLLSRDFAVKALYKDVELASQHLVPLCRRLDVDYALWFPCLCA